MRILHVIPGVAPESGGPTTVLRQLCNRLVERGHVVHVITSDASVSGRRVSLAEARAGYDERVTMTLCRADLVRPPYPSVAHARAVWRAVRRFDVAHVHGVFALPVTQAMAIFRARGMPYVLRPCGMLDDYSIAHKGAQKRLWMRLVEQANLEGAGLIQASTEHEAEAVRRRLPPSRHDRVAVLPQGVEPLPAPSGRRLHTRPYLLFLSRIAEKKGLLLLVEAFSRIADRHPELDLVIVGPDERGHRAVVEARVRERGLTERVHLVGEARGVDKSDWYAGAEAFVLPSHDENFGVVVIEAAQHGLPLIVSDGVGLAAAVQEHAAGLVVPGTAAELADAIMTLRTDGDDRWAAGARTLAAAFGWGTTIARLEHAYARERRVPR